MTKTKFELGQCVYVLNEGDRKTRAGFVVGIKLSDRLNKETNKSDALWVYTLSGHSETWFYEDCLARTGVSK